MFGWFKRKKKNIADDPDRQDYLGVLDATEACKLMGRDLSGMMWSPWDRDYEPVTPQLMKQAQKIYDELTVRYQLPTKNSTSWDCDDFALMAEFAFKVARQVHSRPKARGLGIGQFNQTIFSGRHRANWIYDGYKIAYFEPVKWQVIDPRDWSSSKRASVSMVTG